MVNDWNSLDNEIVTADSVHSFKNGLEKFWKEVTFKFDPTGYHGLVNI